MTTTKIRYGVNKAVRQPHRRTKILHETHTGRIELPFEDKNFLRRVLDLVEQKHPGWNLTGYFPVTTKDDK